MKILNEIKNKRLYFDGGFGSLCIDRGLKFDSSVELSLTNPNEVLKIHKEYIDAGANIITANTFSANCLKYPKNYKKIIEECSSLCYNMLSKNYGFAVFL